MPISEEELAESGKEVEGYDSATGLGGIPETGTGSSTQSAQPNALAHLYRIHEHREVACVFEKNEAGFYSQMLEGPHRAIGVYTDLLPQQHGEVFERISVTRITRYLSQYSPDLSDRQYDFKKGLPTISVIDCAINVIKRKVQKNDIVVALSIDIVNGFNSLTCEKMKEVLKHHMFF